MNARKKLQAVLIGGIIGAIFFMCIFGTMDTDPLFLFLGAYFGFAVGGLIGLIVIRGFKPPVDYSLKEFAAEYKKPGSSQNKEIEQINTKLPKSVKDLLLAIKDLEEYNEENIQSILDSYNGKLILIHSIYSSCRKSEFSKPDYSESSRFKWVLKHDEIETVICGKSYFRLGALRINKTELSSSYMKYHPEQLVYTGATVGGISMGGFHTEQAYYTEQFTSSGRYGLYFPLNNNLKNFTETEKIKEIYMSKKTLSNLPKELTPFIKNGKLILNEKEVSSVYTNSLRAAISQGNQYMYQQLSKQCFLEMHMTNDEATSVLNWINSNFK